MNGIIELSYSSPVERNSAGCSVTKNSLPSNVKDVMLKVETMLRMKKDYDAARNLPAKNPNEYAIRAAASTVALEKYKSAKDAAIGVWRSFTVALPPDEWANWQASLEFDAKKPCEFSGQANPYYTNYTFMRTLTRIPLIEFIAATNFVRGEIWPLLPRVGQYNHDSEPEYQKIVKLTEAGDHEF